MKRGLRISIVVGLIFAMKSFAQPLPSKADLLAAWESHWQALHALEVEFDLQNTAPAGEMPVGLIPDVHMLIRVRGSSWLGQMRRPDGIVEEASFDPDSREARRYNSGALQGWIQSGTCFPVPSGEEYMAGMLRTQVPPGSEGYSSQLDLSLILNSATTVVRPGWEAVNGRQCAVIDCSASGGSSQMTVWLDAERSSVPVRYVLNRSIPIQVDLTDYQQFGESWFPMTIVTDLSRFNGTRQVRRVTRTADGVPAVRINDAVTAPAEVQFNASGTVVMNLNDGSSFVALGASPSTRELIDRAPHVAAAFGLAPQLATSLRPNIGAVVLMALIGTGVGVALRRRLLKGRGAFHVAEH